MKINIDMRGVRVRVSIAPGARARADDVHEIQRAVIDLLAALERSAPSAVEAYAEGIAEAVAGEALSYENHDDAPFGAHGFGEGFVLQNDVMSSEIHDATIRAAERLRDVPLEMLKALLFVSYGVSPSPEIGARLVERGLIRADGSWTDVGSAALNQNRHRLDHDAEVQELHERFVRQRLAEISVWSERQQRDN